MGITAAKPKSSGLERFGLGVDNRKENPRPSQRSSRPKGRLTDYQEREWPEGRPSQQREELALQEPGLCREPPKCVRTQGHRHRRIESATRRLVWRSGLLHQLSRGPADTAAPNGSPCVVALWQVKGTGKHFRLCRRCSMALLLSSRT